MGGNFFPQLPAVEFFRMKFAENVEKGNKIKIILRSFLKDRIPQTVSNRSRLRHQWKYTISPRIIKSNFVLPMFNVICMLINLCF